ncbi:MAG: fibronectin type III domain-containing protein [Dermatophilaceae bacterium]
MPTSGIDPDGDLAYVSGIVGEDGGPVNLKLGRVTSYGASAIRYEAYPMSAGTEVIRYAVTDRYGKSGEGLIRVGVVPPGAPQPPVAVPDEVVAAPGRGLTVDPLANDLVPKNADVVIEDPATVNDPASVAQFARQDDLTFRVTAPEEGPAKVLVYGIDGGLFDPSRASITVRGRSGYNNPPVAVDDVARVAPASPVAAPTGEGAAPAPAVVTTLVDVLANDHDLDGERAALRIIQVGEGASVEDGQVRVVLDDHPRAVPYVIQDADGGRAMAVIYVPANGSDTPYVVAGKPIAMDRDATLAVRLADYVADPRGRAVRVTTPDSVSTSPSQHLSATVSGLGDLVLTARDGYVGPAALMLEVTDSTGPDDQAPRTAYLVLPVQVGPLTPLLRCPDWEVNVVADRPPRVVDIPRLCSAWFPEGLDPASVEYAAQWDSPAPGVALNQRGDGGRQVVLTAAADAVHGAKGTITLGVRGATEHYPLRVRVTSLRTNPGAAAAGPDAPPPPPAAVVRPARVEGLIAGQSQVVNLAQYLDSPFGTLHCAIASVRVVSGTGVTASNAGCLLTVTASSDAQGVSVLSVDVSDAPDRLAPGSVTVTVLSRPGPPLGVTAAADRIQGGSARVAWLPPAYDGGLPVLEYQVSSGGQTLSCPASPCTVTGLTNGVDYAFTVRARNAAGWSDPGGPSAPVRPDTAPGPVTVGAITSGDRTLAISWSPPQNLGSAVDLYNVQAVSLSGGAGGGVFPVSAADLATTLSGLVNDDEYSIRVQAHNEAGWGPYGPSRTAQSVGTPATVPTPALAYPRPTPNDTATPVSISWPAVDPNGPPLVSYTVWTQVEGGPWSVLTTVSAGSARVASDTVPLDGRTVGYAVTATNGGGLTSPRVNVATFTAIGVPQVPRPPSVTTPRPDKTMDVSFSLGGSHARAWTSVNYRTTAGVSGSLTCGSPDCAKSVTLPNGTIVGQTMAIQGCTDAGTCSDWSGPSNSFQPYGPTQPVVAANPAVSGSHGRYDVTFSWDVVENGRPVTVSVTGASCALAADQGSCRVSGVGYDTTVTVTVTASSVAGTAAGVRMSVKTPAKVPVTLVIAPSTTVITCAGAKPCYSIVVTTTQWDAASATCTFTSPAGTIGTATVPTNTTKDTGLGYAGTGTVTATCRNATTGENATDTATWKLPP